MIPEPLLAKTRQLLEHYDRAMGLCTVIKHKESVPSSIEKAFPCCQLCRKYFDEEGSYPCKKLHQRAMGESLRSGKTCIYACKAGFAYWTSPLYRKGVYAGALLSGQVLLCSPQEAMKKIKLHCKNKAGIEEFQHLLEKKSKKNKDEIQAQARLLGQCAAELSEPLLEENSHTKDHPINWKDPKGLSENPLRKNRVLLAALQQGDTETGHKLIKELLDCVYDNVHSTGSHNLEITRIKAMELLVLLSRAAMTPEAQDNDAIINITDRYINRIEKSKTKEALAENLNFAASQMAGYFFHFQGKRHAAALRRALRYVWEHYTRKIKLEEISKAAGLSAPYFSAVFKEEMGENLSGYINRLRIEKAATMLIETSHSMTQIATLSGFEDQSWFSKMFKKYTGVSPVKYRENGRTEGYNYGS